MIEELLENTPEKTKEKMQIWYLDHRDLFNEMNVSKVDAEKFYLGYIEPITIKYQVEIKLYKE